MIKSLDEKEIKDIALKIFKGEIFTSDHIRKEDLRITTTIFIPLIGLNKEIQKDLKDVGFIYEHMSKAGPRSINGYPIFMSLNIVNKSDAIKIWEKVKNIKAVVDRI